MKAIGEDVLGNTAKLLGSLKVMKTQYEKVFAEHVSSAIQRATALGLKATWTTAKHLDALAATVDANPGQTRDVLGECYNVSAYQQLLAKKFEKSGHFQRQKDKPVGEQLDSLLDQLVKQTAQAETQG